MMYNTLYYFNEIFRHFGLEPVGTHMPEGDETDPIHSVEFVQYGQLNSENFDPQSKETKRVDAEQNAHVGGTKRDCEGANKEPS
jgi:hypothetical protein